MKKATTLNIDRSVVEQAKHQGLNMSKIAEKAIMSVLASATYRDEEVYLEYLLKQKTGLQKKVRILKEQYDDTSKRLEHVNKNIKLQQEIVTEMHKSKRIASVIGELNEVIVSYNYDFETIKTESTGLMKILQKLRKDYFTDEWLQKQIDRIRREFE